MRILFVFLIFSSLSVAQPDLLWTRLYGDVGGHYCFDTKRTSDGGFVLVGAESSLDTNRDFFAIKTDSMGDREWSAKLLDEWNSAVYSVSTSLNGDIYLIGKGQSPAEGSALIAKLNFEGDSLWFRQYGGSLAKLFSSVPNEVGGIYACGTSSDFGRYGGYDAYLVNIDPEGDTIWSQVYGERSTDIFWDMIRTLDSGFAFVGESSSYGNGIQFYLVKTDSSGEEEWSTTFGGEGRDVGMALVQTTDGGFALAGQTYVRGEERTNANWMVVRVDSVGEELWTKYFGDNVNNERCYDIINTEDDGFVMVGNESNTFDVYIIRLNCNGDTLWTAKYDVDLNDDPYTIIPMENGSYTITGHTSRGEIFMLRTEPDPLNGVELLDPAFPQQFTVHEPYPNPFNSSTTIAYTLPRPGHVTLTVFDQLGRQVQRLLDVHKPAGLHTVRWHADGKSSGLYFMTLQSGGQKRQMEVVLVR